jgi:hypothetical protein
MEKTAIKIQRKQGNFSIQSCWNTFMQFKNENQKEILFSVSN